MSHAEPEHNRPQEGEEPEEAFPFDPPYRIDKPTTSELDCPKALNDYIEKRINAALAAEREKTEASEALSELRYQQLAAERLKVNQKEGAFMVASDANQKLREQLAAAVEALRQVDYFAESLVARNYEANSPTVIKLVSDVHAALARIGKTKN